LLLVSHAMPIELQDGGEWSRFAPPPAWFVLALPWASVKTRRFANENASQDARY
jgi:hypothetical protein